MHIKVLSVGELETNCYLLWDEQRETLIVDPGDEAGRILDAAQQLDLHIRAVLLTHVHFDHMLAAEEICRAADAPLWAGAGDELSLADPIRNLSGLFQPGKEIALTANRLLHEGDTVTVGSLSLTVWETPGHTPGSICLIGDGVLISGDTLFAGSMGRVDFPGGDPLAMQRSLARLKSLPDHLTVYAGHGSSTRLGDEKITNPYLR